MLRKSMKKTRNSISESEKLNLSKLVFSKLEASNDYKNASSIFVFVSFASEIFTHDFIKNSIKNSKKIYIPYIDKDKNIMYATKLEKFEDLELGFYNILALPKEKILLADPKNINLIIVPGLIFGKNFYRIGYGGGYYDKFMSQNNITAKKVGICFDFQLIEHVEHEAHDVQIDRIITDVRDIERKEI